MKKIFRGRDQNVVNLVKQEILDGFYQIGGGEADFITPHASHSCEVITKNLTS